MNVGILIPGFSPDEHTPAIPLQHDFVRALSRDHSVRLLALRYPHTRTPYRFYGATVYPLGYTANARGLRRLALWWEAIRTLQHLHREAPFDVLHAMWADETGLLAAWAGRLLHIPSVVSILGGELARDDTIGYGLQRSDFSRWVVSQALKANAVTITGSQMRGMIHAAGYAVPPDRLHTVILGVDADRFRPPSTRTTTRRLVSVGSLLKVKDHPTLLHTMAQLQGVELDLIGDGVERGNLERLAGELDVSDRVNFLGAVPHDRIHAHFHRATLHVVSSRHEGMPVVTLEAAACGLPTVSTGVGLLPDHPQMGVTVPVGDPTALANAVRALLDDDERRAALGQSAREAVEGNFTVQHGVDKLVSLYDSLR